MNIIGECVSIFSLGLSIVYRNNIESCKEFSLITFIMWLFIRDVIGVISNVIMFYQPKLNIVYPNATRHTVAIIYSFHFSWAIYGFIFLLCRVFSDLLICITCIATYDFVCYTIAIVYHYRSVYGR